LSAGCIAAGGTLGILIPPSIMLVVMGPVMGVPVTSLFAAAFLPGFLLAGLYTAYTLIRCQIKPSLGPALPQHLRPTSTAWVLKEIVLGIIPVTSLIAATLGSILAGLATATEGAAAGAAGAMILTFSYRRLTWKGVKKAMLRTLGISSMILLLVASSNFFGSVFSRLGSAKWITELLLGANLDPNVMIFAIILVIFILGWPLEWVPIVLIFIPILLPLIRDMGYDLIWFSILVAVTLQTAWLSPPVALSAYFLKGVVPEWDLKDIYIGMIQFMGLQCVGVVLLVFFPPIVTWLPAVLR
ncbi:MAG: TRAP transporter large permease subunit, partial [Syntrophaceae bacterium]|nr:TRAP transporter large permease subunit [Syntrophaceae bacterium]